MTKRYNKIEIAGIINRQVHSLKLFQYFSNRRNFAQVWETDMKSGSIAGKIKPHSKKWKMAFYIISTAAFLAAVTYIGIKFGPKITQLARNPEELREWLNSFGWKGIIIFIGLQVLQVVVAAIPGEFTQLAGGYLYGTFFGTLYSLAGIVLGSVIVFYAARLLGYPLVRLLVSQKQLEKFSFMVNNSKSEAAMFILFLIPGIPKDILTYIAGITPVKPLKFFVIITIGRLPALLGSSFIGHNTQLGNYGIVIAVSAVAAILFFLGLFFRDRIINWTHKLIKRNKEPDSGGNA
mgnify:CR=1 FL=1|jgi:uncharacterized membrane protein YdjX (TVP38/TMEM64 family)